MGIHQYQTRKLHRENCRDVWMVNFNYSAVHLFTSLAVSSLSCRSSLFFVGGELLAAACGIYFPDPRWILGALHGERRVLATGSAGKSLKCTRWNADPEHTDKDARGPSLGGGVCTLGRRLQGCAVGVSDLLQRPEGASVCLLLGLLAP